MTTGTSGNINAAASTSSTGGASGFETRKSSHQLIQSAMSFNNYAHLGPILNLESRGNSNNRDVSQGSTSSQLTAAINQKNRLCFPAGGVSRANALGSGVGSNSMNGSHHLHTHHQQLLLQSYKH